jgi:hypothetical protein
MITLPKLGQMIKTFSIVILLQSRIAEVMKAL